MPSFNYRAVDGLGKERRGNLDAPNVDAAIRQLQGSGLFAFQCNEAKTDREAPWWRREIGFGRRISQAALVSFTRELSTLVNAQLTIDELVRLIGRQDRAARELCHYLETGLRSGSSLSSLIESLNRDFPSYYSPMVRAGELSGRLGQVLEESARLLERSRDISNRIKAALVYPIVLLVMSVVMMTVVLAVLVPSLLPLFEGNGAELPMLLRGFIAARTAIVSYWPFLLAFVAAMAIAACVLWQRNAVREAAHAAILKLPIIGRIVLLAQISRLVRSLALCCAAVSHCRVGFASLKLL